MSLRNIAIVGRGFHRDDLIKHLDQHYWRKNGLWHRNQRTLSECVHPNTELKIVFRGADHDYSGNITSVHVWPDYLLKKRATDTNIYLPEVVDWERFIERCIRIV